MNAIKQWYDGMIFRLWLKLSARWFGYVIAPDASVNMTALHFGVTHDDITDSMRAYIYGIVEEIDEEGS